MRKEKETTKNHNYNRNISMDKIMLQGNLFEESREAMSMEEMREKLLHITET